METTPALIQEKANELTSEERKFILLMRQMFVLYNQQNICDRLVDKGFFLSEELKRHRDKYGRFVVRYTYTDLGSRVAEYLANRE